MDPPSQASDFFKMDTEDLTFLINHLFLPKQLPQEHDGSHQREHNFSQHVSDSAQAFVELASSQSSAVTGAWTLVAGMLDSFMKLHETGSLDSLLLNKLMKTMDVQGVIPVHVVAQNAGVILRRPNKDILTVEYFQASPKPGDVASNIGKLIIQFPHHPRSSMPFNDDCVESTSSFLATFSQLEMSDAIPKTRKAGSDNAEYRDVPDIRYISELFGGIVAGLTEDREAIASTTQYVTKRVGDHVLWENADLPWRRLPKWLILRVAIQTTLQEHGVDENIPFGYKAFITFVHARALKIAVSSIEFPLHVLAEMNKKIGIRIDKISKVGQVDQDLGVYSYIYDTVKSSRARLDASWSAFQTEHEPVLQWTAPTDAEVEAAKKIQLINSQQALAEVVARPAELAAAGSIFDPAPFEHEQLRQISVRSRSTGHSPPKPLDLGSSDEDSWITIVEIEQWVQEGNLKHRWFEQTLPSSRRAFLVPMIFQFHDLAMRFKSTNSDRFSRVFLMMFELWVALDRTVIEEIPMLAEYSPEFNIDALDALVLPDESQMVRLAQIEQHIHTRLSAKNRDISIFRLEHNDRSFSARYFDSHHGYQLRRRQEEILTKAYCARTEKQEEHARKSKEYHDLMSKANGCTHEYYNGTDRWGCSYRSHASWCPKCSFERQAEAISIHLFEWPLPEDRVLSAIVMVELDTPPSFSQWRDVSWMLSRNFDADFSPLTGEPNVTLADYSELKSFFSSPSDQCLTIASRNAKSHLVSHYADKRFPCLADDVVKKHPLHYELFEKSRSEWLTVGQAKPSLSLRAFCTPSFRGETTPDKKLKYSNLTWALESTKHTPNTIIALQSTCLRDLSIHEYMILGHLRAGVRLQWHNMTSALVNSIALGDEEIYILFKHAACQVEAADASACVERQAHWALKQEKIGAEILDAMERRFASVQDNWHMSWTLTILSCIACRLVQLTENSTIRMSALNLLARLRDIIHKFIDNILQRIQETGPSFHDQYRTRLVQLAATSRSTFHVGCFTGDVLGNSQNLFHFIYTSIVLASNTPGGPTSFTPGLRALLEADVILCGQQLPHLRDALIRNPAPFDEAILKIWGGYVRGESSGWKIIDDRWASCWTSGEGGRRSRAVHFNLLNGTLRVDGKALDILPKEIVLDPFYKSIFPKQNFVEISPSTMHGMDYELRHQTGSVQVHFLLQGRRLVVRLRHASNLTAEFVSPSVFAKDIPCNVLDTAVVLYHDDNGRIEFFSARKEGWKPSAIPDWVLDTATTQYLTRFTVDSQNQPIDQILSPHSPSVASILTQVKSLEVSPDQLLVLLSTKSYANLVHRDYSRRHLLIDLPRYNLSFYVDNSDRVASRQFPRFSIASSQALGTLIGLKSKLILESPGQHSIAVVPVLPQSIRTFWKSSQIAPTVMIEPASTSRAHVRTCVLQVDRLVLKRILPQDSALSSWLYLALLHILTSAPLSDPLTAESGIQRAFQMLLNAKSMSFKELDGTSSSILQLVAKCSPTRNFYPPHLGVMESITWNPQACQGQALPPFIMDDRLQAVVHRIFDHNANLTIFRPTPSHSAVQLRNQSNEISVQRAVNRYSRFIPVDEIPQTLVSDSEYSMAPPSSRESQTLVGLASLTQEIVDWAATTAPATADLWQLYCNNWITFSSTLIPESSAKFDLSWIQESCQSVWFTYLDLCLQGNITSRDRFRLAFTLPAVAFREHFNLELVRTLLLVSVHAGNKEVKSSLRLIPRAKFDLGVSPDLTREIVEGWGNTAMVPMNAWDHPGIERSYMEESYNFDIRVQHAYDTLHLRELQLGVDFVWSQWRRQQLETSGYPLSLTLLRSSFKEQAIAEFSARFMNGELRNHAHALESIIRARSFGQPIQLDLPSVPPSLPRQTKFVPVYLQSVMEIRSNMLIGHPVPSVRDIASSLRQSEDNILDAYLDDLFESIDVAGQSGLSNLSSAEQVITPLRPQALSECLLDICTLWPSTNPLHLLRHLSFDRRAANVPRWQECLILYAHSLIRCQQSLRLSRLFQLGQESEIDKEQLGVTPETIKDIDWLLIQLEGDFSIRANQVAVANRMMRPTDSKSLVTQLNMGEGKTSVIIPIVSASLADGEALVHVVVLKPLVDQSFHILKQTVSGIANRPVFFLPFNRDISLSESVPKIVSLFQRCQRSGGVLLAQPEHILSLRLRTTEEFCAHGPTSRLAKELLDFQDWLRQVSRLLLDESDELLKVKYQLIYTIGASAILTGQPRRSEFLQDVLTQLGATVRRFVESQPTRLPQLEMSAEASTSVGRFLEFRILESSSESRAVQVLFEKMVTDSLGLLSFRTFSAKDHADLQDYVTNTDVPSHLETRLKHICGSEFNQILILRGLFAHGLLEHILSDKRHRVDYGLCPSRTTLAVPYRSKDQPAVRAEFGHPDVIILLTLLSYYYTGLTNDQLDATFDLLYRSDNPGLRYEGWIQAIKGHLPLALHSLDGLNLEDENQKVVDLFPHLKFNKIVIDFYTSEVVFPKAREFPFKLTTSAWDLVERSEHPTTGFSGTKDNRLHLPTSIQQDNSPDQLATSAIQLEHLLKPENDKVITTGNDSAEGLLRRLIDLGNVTILLDVGAQILELDNTQLARRWLQLDTRPCYEAVVYFDPERDEPFVLHRDGRVERFQESLYRTQLDKCFVYLDEAHTRGTDFKFPPKAVAVVTLGPRLPKDKLVQGCMRLRQLAAGQRVILFCPSEVEFKIRQFCGRPVPERLRIRDVVKWTMLQTTNELRTGMPLWRQQGTNFVARQATWHGFRQGTIDTQTAADIFREPEAQSLETLYGVAQEQMSSTGPITNPDHHVIIERCRKFGISTSPGSASLLEEQERELAHEKETEREVQRPGPAKPLLHTVDLALPSFIHAGITSSSWLTLADCLEKTSCGKYIPSGLWSSRELLATTDFRDTIRLETNEKGMNDFIRPVCWILSSLRSTALVLISPYEANQLLPNVQESHTAFLHLYSPRDSRNMKILDNLDFMTIPSPRLDGSFPDKAIIQKLNLFSGQLFFHSKKSFEEVCQMLGLWLGAIPDQSKGEVDANGFVANEDARKVLGLDNCRLSESPVEVFQELIQMRRKGQGFMLTHIGKMLYGQELEEKEFTG